MRRSRGELSKRPLAGLDATIGSRDSRGRGGGADSTPPQAVVGTEIAQAVSGFNRAPTPHLQHLCSSYITFTSLSHHPHTSLIPPLPRHCATPTRTVPSYSHHVTSLSLIVLRLYTFRCPWSSKVVRCHDPTLEGNNQQQPRTPFVTD